MAKTLTSHTTLSDRALPSGRKKVLEGNGWRANKRRKLVLTP